MASATKLSINDNAILGALFDPESSLSNSTQVDDSLPEGLDRPTLQAVQDHERQILRPLNEDHPPQTQVFEAINQLTAMIDQFPTYASAWNNRAQTRRMLFEIELLHQHVEELKMIMDDLARAIQLATPNNPLAPVPALNAKVLASAHTHRGYLLYTASRSLELAEALRLSINSLSGADKDALEEMASRDFTLGGRFGNDTARQLAVRTNPYAKLCGSIVKEALQKEVSDYHRSTHGMQSSEMGAIR
jgi:hypothetical protein